MKVGAVRGGSRGHTILSMVIGLLRPLLDHIRESKKLMH